jgi:tetratricopeptide (TPR) repeat protein
MNRRARRAARGGNTATPTGSGSSGELAVAYFQNGNQLAQRGRFAEAAAQYRRALAVEPNYAQALSNLGNALMASGDDEGAIAAWRRAIAAEPAYALPHANLGAALSQHGRLDEAIAQLRRAVELKPDFVDALDNLAKALLAAGQAAQALECARRAIAIKPTNESRKVFVDCLRHVTFPSDDPGLRALLVTALAETWARPDRLIGPAAALAKRNPALASYIEKPEKAWPSARNV